MLVSNGGIAAQTRLFNLAADPGRGSVRVAAANALLFAPAPLDPAVPEMVTPKLLAARIAPIAVRFALLLGDAGPIDAVSEACRLLAVNPKRQALLIAMIWAVYERDPPKAAMMAGYLRRCSCR